MDKYESDSDEAPEVVTKESAQQQAQQQREQEKQARKNQPKRKRKTKAKNEVKELPEDVLTAVAAREEEEEAEEQETEKQREEKRRADAKRAKLMAKKTHTRQFGNIEVKTLDAVEQEKTRELSDSAKAFLERRSAPNRPRMNVMEGHRTLFTKKQKQRNTRA